MTDSKTIIRIKEVLSVLAILGCFVSASAAIALGASGSGQVVGSGDPAAAQSRYWKTFDNLERKARAKIGRRLGCVLASSGGSFKKTSFVVLTTNHEAERKARRLVRDLDIDHFSRVATISSRYERWRIDQIEAIATESVPGPEVSIGIGTAEGRFRSCPPLEIRVVVPIGGTPDPAEESWASSLVARFGADRVRVIPLAADPEPCPPSAARATRASSCDA